MAPAKKKAKKEEKTVIGLVERITVEGTEGSKEVLAKVDTGASRTTADTRLAAVVGLGPITDTVIIRGSTGAAKERRALVATNLTIRGKSFSLPVAISDRADMKYPIIVGMDILKRGRFLIDATRRARLPKKKGK